MIITDALIPGNFGKGRSRTIDMIVIHVMEGTMQGTLSHFRRKDPPDPVSAHYGISRGGEIVRYVRDEDTAWHAGRVMKPTAALVIERPGVNPNSYSIGIENEGSGKDEPTEAQIVANVALIRTLCAKYAIPITRRHVVGHREIFAGKTCPGLIDVSELVSRAQFPAPDVIEPGLAADIAPPNLEYITVPKPEHVARLIQLRGSRGAFAREGLEVAEIFGRRVLAGGQPVTLKTFVDALADYLRGQGS